MAESGDAGKLMTMGLPRFLCVSLWGYPPGGGGEYFFMDTLRWARERGYEPVYLCFEDSKTGPFQQTTTIQTDFGTVIQSHHSLADSMDFWLDQLKPAMVHTQGRGSNQVLHACHRRGIPSIYGIHYFGELLHFNTPHNVLDLLSATERDVTVLPVFAENYGLAAATYVNSEFTREVIETFSGIRVDPVIYPLPDPTTVTADTHGDCVVMLNVDDHKGGPLFFALAQAFPTVPFLGVQMTSRQSPERPNLTLVAGPVDPREVYAQARVVVSPSLFVESFGRIGVEAMTNRLPVLFTRSGYLPQLIGDCGICCQYNKFEEWCQALHRLYTDPAFYARFQQAATRRMAQYDYAQSRHRFQSLMERLVSI